MKYLPLATDHITIGGWITSLIPISSALLSEWAESTYSHIHTNKWIRPGNKTPKHIQSPHSGVPGKQKVSVLYSLQLEVDCMSDKVVLPSVHFLLGGTYKVPIQVCLGNRNAQSFD